MSTQYLRSTSFIFFLQINTNQELAQLQHAPREETHTLGRFTYHCDTSTPHRKCTTHLAKICPPESFRARRYLHTQRILQISSVFHVHVSQKWSIFDIVKPDMFRQKDRRAHISNTSVKKIQKCARKRFTATFVVLWRRRGGPRRDAAARTSHPKPASMTCCAAPACDPSEIAHSHAHGC